jgi:carbon storage regulator
MLYLTRKIGESVIINNSIELVVVEVKGRTVKLGFEFPPEASILRKELHDKIYEQNIAALRSSEDTDVFDEIDTLTLSPDTDKKDPGNDGNRS